jgi:tryptophan synthase alpha subunit
LRTPEYYPNISTISQKKDDIYAFGQIILLLMRYKTLSSDESKQMEHLSVEMCGPAPILIDDVIKRISDAYTSYCAKMGIMPYAFVPPVSKEEAILEANMLKLKIY